MRVVFIGSGAIAVPPLRWLLNSCHDVVAVVTQPDRPAGRGRRTVPTPVKQHAVEVGLDVLQPQDINHADAVTRILDVRGDVGVTVSFGQKIGPDLLDGIPGGCLNIHPSLLPKCRGAAPVNWTIIRGEAKTGVTVFRLVDRLDAGPILAVRETLIRPSETAGELQARLGGVGCDALDGALADFNPSDPTPGDPQDDALATEAPKLTKQMGRIDLCRPAREIVGWVNGLHPWPAVQLSYVPRTTGRPVMTRLARAETVEGDENAAEGPPGTVLGPGTIACSDGAFRILEIQPAGKRTMSWRDFVNGRHVSPGDRFEPLTSETGEA